MKRLSQTLFILAALSVAATGFLFSPEIVSLFRKPIVIAEEPPRVLVDWVYSKSTVISRTTARVIVREVMKTDKPLLVLAICELESQGFNPGALSSKGAVGLGQIMFTDRTHKSALIKAGIAQEARDLFDVDRNIRATDFLLNDFLKRSNRDIDKTLRLYLGEVDGAYAKRILSNLANLYVLTVEKKP